MKTGDYLHENFINLREYGSLGTDLLLSKSYFVGVSTESCLFVTLPLRVWSSL